MGRQGVDVRTGLGLGQELGLSPGDESDLAARAAAAGHASVWTNSGSGEAAFASCERFVRAGAPLAGILVMPSPALDLDALAANAERTRSATAGRFVLGVGTGAYQRTRAAVDASPVEVMRAHIAALRAGSPGTPIHLAALGPAMLRLAGAVADGAALNWCTAEHVRWSRDRVAEGAAAAGRDPADVAVVEYIRVAIGDDATAARRALAKAVLGYALERPGGASGYRRHFARMGFDGVLRDLEAMRARGATADALAEAFPADALDRLGYAGPAAGARAGLDRLGDGLDLAIARVVAVGSARDTATIAIDACAPPGS